MEASSPELVSFAFKFFVWKLVSFPFRFLLWKLPIWKLFCVCVLSREHREPTPEESSARQRHKELVTDEMLDNEMAILAPLQEGMQALPAEEVANEGARAKVNLERFKAKLRDHSGGAGGEQAHPGHQLGVDAYPHPPALKILAWPDDLRQALERGLFCPLELDDPEDIPNVGDIKEKYVPYIRRLREAQNATPAPRKGATGPGGDQPVPPQNLDTEEGKLSLLLWAMKRHQGELRMFGGIWKKHSSGEIPKGADQQFKLSPQNSWPWTAEPTH